MASNQTKSAHPFDTAFERANEAGEQFYAVARKAGNIYLDSYEKAVDRTIDLELKLAGASQQEWLKSIVETQTEVARDVTGAYVTSARALLK